MTGPSAPGSGPTDDAGVLTIGSSAPDFTLDNQHGEFVRLGALRGTAVMVVFFPLAFSGVCTGELGALRDGFADASRVRLLAVSVDAKYALRAFADAERLGFDLLSDFWPHGGTARRYGVFDAERGVARRASFVLDADGVVRARLLTDATHPRSLDDHRRALASLDA